MSLDLICAHRPTTHTKTYIDNEITTPLFEAARLRQAESSVQFVGRSEDTQQPEEEEGKYVIYIFILSWTDWNKTKHNKQLLHVSKLSDLYCNSNDRQ